MLERFNFGGSMTLARRGFTILELIMVLVVAGVVGGMSLGKMHNIMISQRLSRASTIVQTNVEAAFALAGRNRRPIRISWNATNMQMSITDRAGTTVFRNANFSSAAFGLPANSVTFSASPIEIYPTGLASDTLLITLSANSTTKKIWVSRAGLVMFR